MSSSVCVASGMLFMTNLEMQKWGVASAGKHGQSKTSVAEIAARHDLCP
jgi:hypothetical protein